MIIPIFSKTIFLRYFLKEWNTWWVNYNSPENWRRFNCQGCWNLIGDHNATSWPLMTLWPVYFFHLFTGSTLVILRVQMIYVSRKGGNGGASLSLIFARSRWGLCTARNRRVCDDAESSQIANLRYVRTIFMHPTPASRHGVWYVFFKWIMYLPSEHKTFELHLYNVGPTSKHPSINKTVN